MNRRYRTPTILVLAAALLLVGLSLVGWLRPLQSLADQGLNPAGRFFHSIFADVSAEVSLLGSVRQLDNRNASLQGQVNDLKAQLAKTRELQRENDQLRTQLDTGTPNQYNLLPAHVLGADPDSLRTLLQIDRGSTSGLREGMAVIANSGLVGVIDSVDSYSAKILAINDPVFKISALAQDSRATGIIRGQLGTGLKMEKISQTDNIRLGETVITAGSGLVPKGILIGEVQNVNRADNAIFQAASVKPIVMVSKLELVFVITAQKQ